jgi:hypothetical protein
MELEIPTMNKNTAKRKLKLIIHDNTTNVNEGFAISLPISDKQADTLIQQLLQKFTKYNVKIRTKLDNIDKAGVDTSVPCTTKRVSQNSRIYIRYEIVVKNNLTIQQLNSHKKGVCIGITYSKYEELKANTNRNELDDYLFNHIGSDENVSCIIVVMKAAGYSGSSKERQDKLKLEEEAKQNNWFPIRRKEAKGKNVNEGNDKWEGHYHYMISGGEQETLQSWEGKEPQIFTTHKGFMTSPEIINANYISLLYMMLHIADIDKVFENAEELENYKCMCELYLKQTIYLNKSCYDLIGELKCFNKNKKLVSPILCNEISIDDFCQEHRLNISHNMAVSKNIILFCEENQIMLSDYRPGNLFWDFKLANMRQQDDTIEEYWITTEKSIELRKNMY